MSSVNENKENYLLLSMKKTACYGSCPVYEIEIYSNLELRYTGEKFVDRIGKYSSRITQMQLDELKTAIETANIFEMENEYTSAVSDLPTTYVYYSNGKKTKKIKDYTGAPESLKRIESKIANLLETQDWKELKE